MSKFRELVEDVVTPAPETTTYTYLTPECQTALDAKIEDVMDEIDISTLQSAYWDPNPYGVEPQLIGSSAGWEVKDENEWWDAACEKLIKYLTADGAYTYLYNYLSTEQQDNYDEEFDQALTKEAIDYVEKQESKK